MFETSNWSDLGFIVGMAASLVTISAGLTSYKKKNTKKNNEKNNVAIDAGSNAIVNNVSSSGSSTINITNSPSNPTLVPESLALPDFRFKFPHSSRGTGGPSNGIKIYNYGGHAYNLKISCEIKQWGDPKPTEMVWEHPELGRSQHMNIMVKTMESFLIFNISCLDANGVNFSGRYQCNLSKDLRMCSYRKLKS